MKAPFINPNKVAGAIGAATIFASQLFTPTSLNAAVPITVSFDDCCTLKMSLLL